MPIKGLPNQATDGTGYPNNDDRASWADKALFEFATNTGQNVNDEPMSVVTDFIADLAHWCDRNDVDLQDALETAAMHYDAETQRKGKQLVFSGFTRY